MSGRNNFPSTLLHSVTEGIWIQLTKDRSHRKKMYIILLKSYMHRSSQRASQVALVVKNPPAKAGDARGVGSNSGSGRLPGEGNGNPLQNSCLEYPMDRRAWGGEGIRAIGLQRVGHDCSDSAQMQGSRRDVKLLWHPSSSSLPRVKPNKPQCQRKVYRGVKQGEWAACTQKTQILQWL